MTDPHRPGEPARPGSPDAPVRAGEPARARLRREPDTDLAFDPDDPWFADAPLIAVNDGDIDQLRGTLSARERGELGHRLAGATEPLIGVLTNALGAITLARPGQLFGDDPRDIHTLEDSTLLYGRSLREVAARLRAIAAFLDHAQATGWSLHAIHSEGLTMTVAPDRASVGGVDEPPYPDYAHGADLSALAPTDAGEDRPSP